MAKASGKTKAPAKPKKRERRVHGDGEMVTVRKSAAVGTSEGLVERSRQKSPPPPPVLPGLGAVPPGLGPVFDAEQRRAFLPPERLRPSEWAERHRRLSSDQSPVNGPWRNELSPYLVGIMDIGSVPGVVQVNVMKAPQIGVSEAMRNRIGWRAATTPVPCGLTLPDRNKGRQIVQDRIIPLFKTTPKLRPLLSSRKWDTKSEEITLINGFRLFLMWSGSESVMASNPMSDVYNDEVDKFQPFAGRDVDAVTLTRERMALYIDRGGVQYNVSTPTTRAGKIFQLIEQSDVKLYFFVPCPHCGAFQRLVWPQLKYPKFDVPEKERRAAMVLAAGDAVYYECEHCGGHITEAQRPAMVRAGRWSTEDESIPDALAVAEWPRGTRIGMQVWAAYSLLTENVFASICARWIMAQGDFENTMAFRTQCLGEPFEQFIDHAVPDTFSAKCRRAELPEGIVPAWSACLLGAVDTQKDHFYVVLRAWGPGMRSARVWHGRVESFAELHEVCFGRPWAVEGDRFAPQICHLVGIDTGGTTHEEIGDTSSRTMQVYNWAWYRRARVRCFKGASRPMADTWIRRTSGILRTGGQGRERETQVPLFLLDVHHYQDELADLIERGVEPAVSADGAAEAAPRPDLPEPEAWMLNQRDDPEYDHHLAAMTRVRERRGTQFAERWVPTASGVRVDYRMCEVYQVALAYLTRIHLLPEAGQFERLREEQVSRNRPEPAGPSPSGAKKKTGSSDADDAWTATPWRNER